MALDSLMEMIRLPGALVKRVHGGDINEAYCVQHGDEKYFLKLNDKELYPQMFEKEKNGLELLADNCSLVVPKSIKHGEFGSTQYILMEWLEQGTPGPRGWKEFGKDLAGLHKKSAAYFGLSEDNYIGSLVQVNEQSGNWKDFYSGCRILPLSALLYEKHDFSRQVLFAAESFCSKIDEIFPKAAPSLLHGDLWNGNYMFINNGTAAVFDPAVYFGHREMDLGMSKLFGGFSPEFYRAYHDEFPLEAGWDERIMYSQLYPLLVHALLFGGHYIQECREILKPFL